MMVKLNVKVAFFGADYLKDAHATVQTNLQLMEKDQRHRWHAIPIIRDTQFKFCRSIDTFSETKLLIYFECSIQYDLKFVLSFC